MQFYGVNLRDEKPTAEAFDKTSTSPTPASTTRTAASCWPCPAYVPPGAVPTTLVLDKQGRVASRVLGEIDKGTLKVPHQRRRGRVAVDGDGLAPMTSPFAEAILNGSAAAGHPGGPAGRTRLLPVAVRAAAGSRLPGLRHGTDRRRPAEAAPRPDAGRHRPVRPRVSPSIFVLLGGAFGQLGTLITGSQNAWITQLLGILVDRHGRRVHGRLRPGCQRDAKIHCQAAGRAVGRAAAGHHLRAGLGAVHRPHLLRGPAAEPLRRIVRGQGRLPGLRVQPGAGHPVPADRPGRAPRHRA